MIKRIVCEDGFDCSGLFYYCSCDSMTMLMCMCHVSIELMWMICHRSMPRGERLTELRVCTDDLAYE